MSEYSFNIGAHVMEALDGIPVQSSIIKDGEAIERENQEQQAQAEVKVEDFSINEESKKVDAILADVAALEMLQMSLRPGLNVNQAIAESLVVNIASRNNIDLNQTVGYAFESLCTANGVATMHPSQMHNTLNANVNYVTESLLDAIKDIASTIGKKLDNLRKHYKEAFSNNLTNMKEIVKTIESRKPTFKEGSVQFDYSERLTRNGKPAVNEIMKEIFTTMDDMTHGFDFSKMTQKTLALMEKTKFEMSEVAQNVAFQLPKVFKEEPMDRKKSQSSTVYRWHVSDGSSMALPGIPGKQLYSPFMVNYDMGGMGFDFESEYKNNNTLIPVMKPQELSNLMKETIKRYETYETQFDKMLDGNEEAKKDVYNVIEKHLRSAKSPTMSPVKEGLWEEIKKGASSMSFQPFDGDDRRKVKDEHQWVVTVLNILKFLNYLFSIWAVVFYVELNLASAGLITVLIGYLVGFGWFKLNTWVSNIQTRIVFWLLCLIIGKDEKEVKPLYDDYVQAFNKLTPEQQKKVPDPNDTETARRIIAGTDMNQFIQRFAEDMNVQIHKTLSDNTINMTFGFANLLNIQASALVAYYDACNQG